MARRALTATRPQSRGSSVERPSTQMWGASGVSKMREFPFRLWREEAGQDLTEYALLLVLIAVAASCLAEDAGQYHQ